MFSMYITQLLANRRHQGMMMAQDPWGNRPEEPNNTGKKEEGPPDLDEFFSSLLGRKKGNQNGHNGAPSPSEFPFNSKLIMLGVAVIASVWLASGFYTVTERENGVETVLGKYSNTSKSGLNWNWPRPLGHVEKVDVQSISTMRIGEFRTQKGSISTQDQRVGQMLTKDENIVEIGAAVQYRINDGQAYIFNAASPEEVLRDVVTSAIREVVGANDVDDVLKDRRNEWPQQAKQIIVSTLNKYNIGIEIVALELQDARVPVEVQDAFEDAVRAREDEERLRLEAEAFANERLPMARGDAEQRLQAAQAYSATQLALAEAEATRFKDLLAVYQKDKSAMRARLYLDTMNAVYADSQKIIVDKNIKPIINLDGKVDKAALDAAATTTQPQTEKSSPQNQQTRNQTISIHNGNQAHTTTANDDQRSRSRERNR